MEKTGKASRGEIFCVASILLSVAIGLGSAQAQAITLNFDELAPGTVLSTQYASLGVVFSNSHTVLRIADQWPGDPFTPPNAVAPLDYTIPGNYNLATFSVPVNSVSVTMGDYDDDADHIYLQLYDSAWNLLASDDYVLPWDLYGGYTLSASVAGWNVAHAKFWALGINENSCFFDNFSFNTRDGGTIPEPATVLLVGSSLGLWRLASRRRRQE